MGSKVKALVELTKPRALVMIVFTTCLSYMIAVTDGVDLGVLAHTVIGVTLAAGGSLALNQHMERKLDARMKRTGGRPIPSGRVSPELAFAFGMGIMLFGFAWLWFMVNPACSLATIVCGVSYNYMYTPLKLRTSFSSFVGAIPGGMLPVMGWAAARGKVELGGWILFVILFLWQIPHALIISIRHRADYESVGMKQLPVVSDERTSRRQMVWNTLALIPVSLLPFQANLTETVYPFIALVLGLFLVGQVAYYTYHVSERNAKRVFIALSAYLPLLLLAMYFDKPA
ncbi:MAG: heme o synthase [Acidobacteriota bacterium]|nr:heme o synthase [Acidobacteriota bacterium]